MITTQRFGATPRDKTTATITTTIPYGSKAQLTVLLSANGGFVITVLQNTGKEAIFSTSGIDETLNIIRQQLSELQT